MVITVLNKHGYNNSTFGLTFSPTNLPYSSPNSLNDFNLTAFGINERNTIQRRYIDALSQAFRIGQDTSVVTF